MPQKTRVFHFSTGVVGKLKPVSPFIRQQVDRSLPMPDPPMAEVRYAENDIRQEPNPADPAYIAAIEQRNVELGQILLDVIFEHGVDVPIDYDKLGAARGIIEGAGGTWPTKQSDKLCYIKFCCIGVDGEDALLLDAIRRGYEVTEEDVAAALRTFQRDVSRT